MYQKRMAFGLNHCVRAQVLIYVIYIERYFQRRFLVFGYAPVLVGLVDLMLTHLTVRVLSNSLASTQLWNSTSSNRIHSSVMTGKIKGIERFLV